MLGGNWDFGVIDDETCVDDGEITHLYTICVFRVLPLSHYLGCGGTVSRENNSRNLLAGVYEFPSDESCAQNFVS